MAQRARGAAAGARPAARGGVRGESRAPRRPGSDLVTLRARLHEVIEPVVAATGLDLEELAVTRAGRRHLVRITVDGDSGVGHDELSDVSREISAALDAAEESGGELTSGAYTLEVSSPGVDRPLTLPRHWRRNVGRLVVVRAGDRTLTGRILAADESVVSLDAGRGAVTVAFTDLGPGRVQVEFSHVAELADDLGSEDHEEYEDEYDDAEPDSGELTERPREEEDGA